MAGRPERVAALYVVYDADGTRVGELLYMIRKLLGIAHCAACDITHGPRAEKPAFTRLKTGGWSVPLLNIHRDEMDDALAGEVGRVLPAVAARTVAGRDVLLLGPRQLDDCCGDVGALEVSINAALAGVALVTPPFPPSPAPQEHANQQEVYEPKQKQQQQVQRHQEQGQQHLKQPQSQLYYQTSKKYFDKHRGHSHVGGGGDDTVPVLDVKRETRLRQILAPDTVEAGSEDVTSSLSRIGEFGGSASSTGPADVAPNVAEFCLFQHRGEAGQSRTRRGSSPARSSSPPASIPIAHPGISRQSNKRRERTFFDAAAFASSIFGVPLTKDTSDVSYVSFAESDDHFPPSGASDIEKNAGQADAGRIGDCDAVVPGSYA